MKRTRMKEDGKREEGGGERARKIGKERKKKKEKGRERKEKGKYLYSDDDSWAFIGINFSKMSFPIEASYG